MANKQQGSSTRRWHRSIGVSTSIFVVLIVISGLVLNHTHKLGLDKYHISHPSLLSWYGLKEPGQLQSFAVGKHWLTFAGSQLYLDDNSVAVVSGGVGAVRNGDWLIAAGSDELLLLNLDGELIERQPWGHPEAGKINALGRFENGAIVVRSADELWLADSDFLEWKKLEAGVTPPHWSSRGIAPAVMQQNIVRQYQGSGLSLERLLLDIHSGRIFGTTGMILYDLVALTLGLLALSGLLLWVRGQRNGRGKE
jgi:hypothetical protein